MATKVAEERLTYVSTLYAEEDKEKDEINEKLRELGIDIPREKPKMPMEKAYFNGEMLQKYEPCMDALQSVIDADGEDDDAWKTFEETFGKFMDFSWCSNWDGIRYDIVVYGCSGYTGYLTIEYLKRIALKRNPEPFTFALAGRTASKVAALRDKCLAGTRWADTKVLAASYDDPVSIIDLTRSARCIYNVAGPYMLTPGEMMLDACCFSKTHYVDINGEIPWMVRAFELHERARDCGAIIAPASAVAGGFPDLLVSLCANEIKKKTGEELENAMCLWTGGGSGAGTGGGTLATRAAMSSGGDAIRKIMADPFALGGFVPDRDRNGLKEATIKQGTGEMTTKLRKGDQDAALSKMKTDERHGVMLLPQTYAYFDTRIVRRTNALLADYCNRPYGRNFNFQEYSMIPLAMMAEMQASGAMGGAPSAAAGGVDAEKEALEKAGKYYKQGEGPPLEDLGDAWTCWNTWAESPSGNGYARHAMVGSDGYFETARMAVETAFTTIFDYDELEIQGGIITCASMGADKVCGRVIGSGIKYFPGRWPDQHECTPPTRDP